jgi:hypothetical protein
MMNVPTYGGATEYSRGFWTGINAKSVKALGTDVTQVVLGIAGGLANDSGYLPK